MIKRNSWWKVIVSFALAVFFIIYTLSNIDLYRVVGNRSQIRYGFLSITIISSVVIMLLGMFKFNLSRRAELIVGIVVYAMSMAAAMTISIVYSNGFWSSPYIFLVNTAFYIIAAMITILITGNIPASSVTALMLSLIFNGIGFLVYCFRGMALTPTDIYAFRTAMNVASEYSFSMQYQMITATVMAVAFIMLAYKFPLRLEIKNKGIKIRAASVIVIGLCVLLIATVDVEPYYISVFDQYYANRHYGSAFSFYVNTLRMGLEKNDTYDKDKLNAMLDNYTEDNNREALQYISGAGDGASEQMPNVIVVMNESFADFNLLGDFETNEDYLPFFRSLRSNTIRGELLVSPYGGNTCNSEYEFLTGMNTGLLHANAIPYAQMIFGDIPYSMVTHMKELGYYATAFHPYKGNGWNRNNIYRYMGFDKFISYETLKEYNMYPRKIRGYVSDHSDFGTILNYLFGKQDKNRRDFIFNVTMQNHGSYKFEHFRPNIMIENAAREFPQTEQYLSVVKYTDEALAEFLYNLKQFDEPTIVLMYGDHQPKIEDGFYKMLLGKQPDMFTNEEMMQKYRIPFIIWANYDIEEQTGIYTSPCFLSGLLMEAARLPKSRVQMFLDDLQKYVRQTNPLGYYDAELKWHDGGMNDELFSDYYDMQYGILTGEELDYDFDFDYKRYILFNGHRMDIRPSYPIMNEMMN
ncbi:MAG: sulfatase-like hydrolase/transferase [Clostridia bacterium]|nr:sulfatase-like hydrolase/transferase [Clostridia bacterium]